MRVVGVVVMLLVAGVFVAAFFFSDASVDNPLPVIVNDGVEEELLDRPTIPDPLRIAPKDPSAGVGERSTIRFSFLNAAGVEVTATPSMECSDSQITASGKDITVESGEIVEGEMSFLVPHFTAPVIYACRLSLRDEFGTTHEVAFRLDVI